MLAAITLGFDPLLRAGELTIRWQTIGVTVALLLAFAVAASMATRAQLRLQDLVLILAATVPGAVVGGRLAHALAYWDAYSAAPLSVLDPAVGSLSLLGAVIGGFLAGVYLARLVRAPVRRWAQLAAVPLLLAIGLGKIAQLLGGSGQGLPFDAPWAVAFIGNGPWVSANPAVPAHPSQLYEAILVLAGILVLVWLQRRRRLPAGGVLVVALGWFFAVRLLVGFTWRDAPSFGPLNGEQVLALGALLAVALYAATQPWLPRKESPGPGVSTI